MVVGGRMRDEAIAEAGLTGPEFSAVAIQRDLGIGGSHNPGQLKCLHAHAAYALARPGYELGERILAELGDDMWPETCCSASTIDDREH